MSSEIKRDHCNFTDTEKIYIYTRLQPKPELSLKGIIHCLALIVLTYMSNPAVFTDP